jgi:hypothetical protein
MGATEPRRLSDLVGHEGIPREGVLEPDGRHRTPRIHVVNNAEVARPDLPRTCTVSPLHFRGLVRGRAPTSSNWRGFSLWSRVQFWRRSLL